MLRSKDIFRKYDIRGIYGESLTEGDAEDSARAFATQVIDETGKNTPTISVGRDVRSSSIHLFKAVCKGLTESGVNVIDLGVCPSPLTYFSMHSENTDGYMMITGSHNPSEFNGIKVGTKNTVFHSEKIEQIYNYIINKNFPKADKPGGVKAVDIIPKYISYIVDHFRNLAEDIKDIPVRVVLDSGSGTASEIAPEIFRKLGAEVFELYCKPDGNFPGHHPDPTVESNMAEAKEILLSNDADLAVGYDGDADRLGALNSNGEMIWGDQLICIFADSIAKDYQGSKVVADVKASRGLYEFIESIGMKPVMYLSGHSMIKVKMKEVSAIIGGEMSSHFFFSDRYYGYDDGIYASLRLLEAYVNKKKAGKISRSSELTDNIPKYINTPEIREKCPDNVKFKIVSELKKKLADQNITDVIDIDGLRVNFENGWALVRASNTEPLLVTRYEAVNAEAFDKIKSFITKMIKEIEDDIQKRV